MGDEPHNPYAPPAVAQVDRMVAREAESISPKGIGGLLVVSLIGVIVVGLLLIVTLVGGLMAAHPSLVQLTRPGVALRFAGGIALFSAMIGMTALAVVWMFAHDRRLPKLMIVFYVLQGILWVVAAVFSYQSPGGSDAYQAGYAFGQWFWPGRCVLWIWYYLSSERVKNTFVK